MVAIFKRKGKAAKEVEKKEAEKPAEEATPKPAYKHVPTHAASDSVGQGGRSDSNQDRGHIAIASRRRAENSMFDSTLGNAAYAQSIAHELAHGTPSPMSPFGHQQRYQDEPYYGDFETPPTPGPASLQGSSKHLRMSRQSSDYFTQSGQRGRPYESRPQVYGKSKEQGYATPYYSDSGYESAGPPSVVQSRNPSLQNLQDLERQYMSNENKGLLLPEPTLGEEITTLTIDTEHFGSGDMLALPRKSLEGVLKNPGNVSPIDIDADARSTKSSASISKRTRFEDDPMPALDQLQHHREISSPHAEQTVEERATCSNHEQTKREELSEPPVDSATSSPVGSDTELEQKEPKSIISKSHLKTLHPAYRPTSLQRVSSAPSSRRLPPLSILEGFKVNKKGKILDEEGEVIGELIEGDLLDCVRQKASANGEVQDEYGRVVGVVRTIAEGVEASRQSTSNDARQASIQTARPQSVHHSRSESAVSRISQQYQAPKPQRKAAQPPAELVADDMEAGQPTSKDFAAQEQPRRGPVPRSASERSLSDLSKPFARPTMTSVPENNIPEDDAAPESPGLYSFKGDVPTDDQPQNDARLRSRSPPTMQGPARPSLAGGHPNSQMYTPTMSSQIYPGGRMGPRRATTHFSGYGAMNNVPGPKLMMNQMGRSPLSSHETSPKRSDAGESVSENGRPMMGHARSASMLSSAASGNKPRTYFTHGGKITVDANAPKPEKPAVAKPVEEPVEEKKTEKKKSRLSLSFGKKDKAAK